MPFGWQFGHDPFQIWLKAHIEHAICFVQYKVFQLVQPESILVHQVQQPPGRRNDNMRATLHRFDLPYFGDTSIDQRMPQKEMGSISCEAIANLNDQLPGRSEDQCFGKAWYGLAILLSQAMENWQGECRGFACTGLCASKDIPAFQSWRDRLHLNRSWFDIVGIGKCLLQLVDQFDFLEIHGCSKQQVAESKTRCDESLAGQALLTIATSSMIE